MPKCRLVVTCGRPLYGIAADQGFSDCWTVSDDGHSKLVARDLDRGVSRTEPWIDLDERTHRMTLGDRAPGWRLDLALD